MPHREFITINGTRLSYLDYGGNGAPLLALHGHYGCGRMFDTVARALQNSYHFIALDQRGHGWSDSPDDYSRAAYLTDILGLIRTLELGPVILLGHSLGGLNAYQFAARHPGMVRALIVEDIAAQINLQPLSTADWPERFPNLRTVTQFLAEKGFANDTYFLESLVEYPDGWGFRFHYETMQRSQQLIAGNWWGDWLGSSCPAILLHGHQSWALTTPHAHEMVNRRPNTRLAEFPECGHTIHDDDPAGFIAALQDFLDDLPTSTARALPRYFPENDPEPGPRIGATPTLYGTMAEKLIARRTGPRIR